MTIDKAIKKQYKSYRRFMIFNCFIFFVLAYILFYFKNLFLGLKLFIILLEIIICIICMRYYKTRYIKYIIDGDKIIIKLGIFNKIVINCNKVVIVHCEKELKKFKIFIVIMSRIKRNQYDKVTNKFLNNNKIIKDKLKEVKYKFRDRNYYYVVINKNAYIKYKLLNDIYVKCINSIFTDNVINKIKMYRK